MMVSPKAAQAAGEKFGANPVCSGPFRFVERVAQDRIVVERYPNYWNKGEIHFDKIVYLPIVDSTVRLANLRSGQLDFIERVAPSDIRGLKSDSRFKVARITEIGYQGITINVGKSESRRRIRSARTRACARRSSSRSTATGSCRSRWTARRRSATSGCADQLVLREEHAGAQARRRDAPRRC